jgi:hypothetical protein
VDQLLVAEGSDGDEMDKDRIIGVIKQGAKGTFEDRVVVFEEAKVNRHLTLKINANELTV